MVWHLRIFYALLHRVAGDIARSVAVEASPLLGSRRGSRSAML